MRCGAPVVPEHELGRCSDHQMIRGARHCLELHFSDSLNLLSHLLLARDQLMVQCAEGLHHRATVGYLDVAVGPCGWPYATWCTIKSAVIVKRPWVAVPNVFAIHRTVEFGMPCWGFGDGSWSCQKVNESWNTVSRWDCP